MRSFSSDTPVLPSRWVCCRAQLSSFALAALACSLPALAQEAELSVAALAVSTPGTAEAHDVTVVTEIAGAGLVAGVDGSSLDGSIGIAIRDGAGTIVDELDQPFVLPLSQWREDLLASGLRYFAAFTNVPPGRYEVLVTVASAGNGASGDTTTPLEIASPGEPSLWPPLVVSTNDRWLSYKQSVGEAAALPDSYPFVRGDGTRYVPSARPQVPLEVDVPVELVVHRAPRSLRFAGTVTDAGGRVLENALEIEDRAGGGEDGTIRLRARLDTSRLRDQAEYSLRASFSTENMGPELVSSITIVAADRDVTENSVPEVERTPRRSYLAPGSLQLDVGDDEVAQRLLQLSAFGEIARSLEILRDMREGRIDEDTLQASSSQLRRRASDLIGTAKRIAHKDAGALLPLVLIQRLLSDGFARVGQVTLGAHSVYLQRQLLLLYIERIPNEQVPTLGADLLAASGDYYGALELNPDHLLSLRRLAMSSEQSGDWATARAHLERLALLLPGDEEVVLRLAFNQHRTDDTEAARTSLRRILSRSQLEPWVAILAFQELAALEAGLGSFGSSTSLLERALEVFPQSQRLRLQLAFFYEREGRRRDAERLLNRIEAPVTDLPETPRSWYTREPTDQIRALRSAFVEMALAEIETLESILERGEEGL